MFSKERHFGRDFLLRVFCQSPFVREQILATCASTSCSHAAGSSAPYQLNMHLLIKELRHEVPYEIKACATVFNPPNDKSKGVHMVQGHACSVGPGENLSPLPALLPTSGRCIPANKQGQTFRSKCTFAWTETAHELLRCSILFVAMSNTHYRTRILSRRSATLKEYSLGWTLRA